MAFTYTRAKGANSVGKSIQFGSYTSDGGSTGGAIATGLKKILSFQAASATATPSVVVTLSGGTATITTTANQTGTWFAIGA
jgi:hypothetical protein